MGKTLKAIMIGAGARGASAYAPYALKHPDELQFIGVAEPDLARRDQFIYQHRHAADNAVDSWQEILDRPKFGDIVFICTQDQMHFAPAKAAIKKGYDIFIEKPVAINLKECQELAQLAKKYGVSSSVGHVLRYTTFFRKIKQIIDSGDIGKVVSVQHNENVGHIHMSHSFVRGAWRNSESSSPMILAKSCHDMDILTWLLSEPCQNLSSFGSLLYFHKGNAPEGAPDNCLSGCPVKNICPYYAPRVYIDDNHGWAKSIHIDHLNTEERLTFLKESPYGSCVFHADNNVVDHQVVNMLFPSGATAAFTMSAFTAETSRTIKIMATKGVINGNMEENELRIENLIDETVSHIELPNIDGPAGHGDGDLNLVHDFVAHCQNKSLVPELAPLRESLMSHAMAFAAEESRINKKNVEIENYINLKEIY